MKNHVKNAANEQIGSNQPLRDGLSLLAMVAKGPEGEPAGTRRYKELEEGCGPTLRPGETAGMFAPAGSGLVGRPCGLGDVLPPPVFESEDEAHPAPWLRGCGEDSLSADGDDATAARWQPAPRTTNRDMDGGIHATVCDTPGVTYLTDLIGLVARSRQPQAGEAPAPQDPCYGGGVSGTGDVEGPAVSTDNALARYDGASGNRIQNSGVILGDQNEFIGVTAVVMTEQPAALPIAAGQGQYWVSDNGGDPTAPRFTSDDTVDHALMLGSNNLSDVANTGTARTNLGVGTLDSPQFAALNVGHASDTTITRVSAGNLAVEGNTIYRAGGTDVAIADGGTGASTADAAVQNLTNGATSRIPVLTDEVPFNDVGTAGGKTTPQAVFNLVNSLTAETAVAVDDKLPVYDTSAAQTDAVRADLACAFERKMKLADQSYSSDTTLSDDNTLQVALISGANYIIEYDLIVTSAATPDFKLDFAGSLTSFTSFAPWLTRFNVAAAAAAINITSPTTVHALTHTDWPLYVHICLGVTPSASGTLILRHAQNTSNATATGLLRGSNMKVMRVS